jgi:hypothetical protein
MDAIFLVVPISAIVLCIVPVGAIGAPIGFALATVGGLIACDQTPSRDRNTLIAGTAFALLASGALTCLVVIDLLR